MARKKVHRLKDFTNVEEVFAKLLEKGFFFDEDHMREQLADLTQEFPSPHESNEFWYSNRAQEVKIFRGWRGTYELCNFRGQMSPVIDELFAVASMPPRQ